MSRFTQLRTLGALCLISLSWVSSALAISLGSPQLQSRPGEPLRVEIPLRVSADEKNALDTLKVALPPKSSYERLGVGQKVLELNPQAMVYRNRADQLVVLVETVSPVPSSEDPFLDVLVTLNWSNGSMTKAFTLLIGDAQKITVKSGQTLSEIAAQMAPQLEGATLDQTIMALYKANPDAFASGSINRLAAGAELSKPSQALLRSISPAEAYRFVADANEEWRQEQSAKGSGEGGEKPGSSQSSESVKDRSKIGSSSESNEQDRRYTENLVAQEKELELAKARVAELEKNIADLQRLLDKSKTKKTADPQFGLGGFGPAILAVGLISLTGLLLWGLARNSRRSEAPSFQEPSFSNQNAPTHAPSVGSYDMPERAKALFAGIDLDLSKPAKEAPPAIAPFIAPPDNNPLADTLRVKLNLARAYITIEDFVSAKKSLEEILLVSNTVDPAITIEAQGLLAELSQRQV